MMRFVRPGAALLGFSPPELQAHAGAELRDNPFLEERRAPVYSSRAALVAAALSLPKHLAEQLRIGTDDPAVLAIGEFLIGNLDDDGYLQLGMGEAAELARVAVQRVDEVLKLIQGFDPPGVATRTLAEGLLLQLEFRGTPNGVAVEVVTRLEDLANLARSPLGVQKWQGFP